MSKNQSEDPGGENPAAKDPAAKDPAAKDPDAKDPDANDEQRANRPRRRWPRYRLSTMLVLITIAAIGFAWVHREISRARAEARAIEELLVVVGNGQVNVLFGHRFGDRDNLFRADFAPEDSRFQAWIESTVGVDPFNTVKSITIYGVGNGFSYGADDEGKIIINATYVAGLKDEDAHLLANFPYLESLRLEANPIGDEGAVQIAKLRHLSVINLGNTAVTDVGILRLASLDKLRHVNIGRTLATDAVMPSLASRPLESLNVTMTNISDEAIKAFQSQHPDCEMED